MVGSRYKAWPPASVNTSMKQFFLLLLIGLVRVFAQSIPWNYIVPRMGALNLSFVFVIFLALYCPSIGSLFIAFLLGYVLDALSGVPAGLQSLVNLFSFFLIRAASRVILFESMFSQAVLVFLLSFSADLFLLKTTRIVASNPFGSILMNVLANTLLSVALCIPLFIVYKKRYASAQD